MVRTILFTTITFLYSFNLLGNFDHSEYFSPHILYGKCKLSESINPSYKDLFFCINPSLQQNFIKPIGRSNSLHHHLSKIHFSVHSPIGFNLHIDKRIFISIEDSDLKNFTKTDQLSFLVEIGTPGESNFLTSFGKQKLPFGVNSSTIQNSIYFMNKLIGETDIYWNSNPYSLVLKFDNKENLTSEVAYGANTVNRLDISRSTDYSDMDTSLRIMYDNSSWLGTRFYGSLYAHQKGERRWGVSVLTNGVNGSSFIIEIARKRSRPDGKKNPFKQIIQSSFSTQFKNNKREYLAFTLLRKISNNLTYGQEYLLSKFLSIDFSLLYSNSLTQSRQQLWAISGGINIKL